MGGVFEIRIKLSSFPVNKEHKQMLEEILQTQSGEQMAADASDLLQVEAK